MFMVPCKIPGGKMTAAQYLALDDLAGEYANGTIRITSRQGIQLHGVLKHDLKAAIAGINQCLLTTLGACGDVERNVMATPAPIASPLHRELQETGAGLAAHFAPRTGAYHEIWLDGEEVSGARARERGNAERGSAECGSAPALPRSRAPNAEVEPIYGKLYLPRKFKTGLAFPEDNSIDIYAQDLGFLGIVENEAMIGYNVLGGGGMGMTHGNANTFPHLARPICYVPADQVEQTDEAVVRLFRDHGNRGDRKRARIKYLVHDWGVEKFRRVFAEYVGAPLADPKPVDVADFKTHHGWHPQAPRRWYLGVSIEDGRVQDAAS